MSRGSHGRLSRVGLDGEGGGGGEASGSAAELYLNSKQLSLWSFEVVEGVRKSRAGGGEGRMAGLSR